MNDSVKEITMLFMPKLTRMHDLKCQLARTTLDLHPCTQLGGKDLHLLMPYLTRPSCSVIEYLNFQKFWWLISLLNLVGTLEPLRVVKYAKEVSFLEASL